MLWPNNGVTMYEIRLNSYEIRLNSGEFFDFSNAEKATFDIEDIAHALSQIPRFNGHTDIFYSVAQHSIETAQILPDHLKLQGLLHDAEEFVIGDITTPLKRFIPEIFNIGEHIRELILDKYCGVIELDYEVKVADRKRFITECIMLFSKKSLQFDEFLESEMQWWIDEEKKNGLMPDFKMNKAMNPEQAKEAFLNEFYQYSKSS
jgi:hypothetical protein